MRKFSFIRAAVLAAGGSGVLCFATSSKTETILSVSLPPPMPDSLIWPWRTMQVNSFRPMFMSLDPSEHGFGPLFCSSPNAFPGVDSSKGAAKDADDCPRQACHCFGVDTIPNAAAKVGPAVVNLKAPQGRSGNIVSVGSGTIIDENGTILTCAHVVIDFPGSKSSSQGKVEVTMQDGRKFEGTVMNIDIHSDVALVKIKSKTPLPTAKLGSSSKLRPGDLVIALGCPLTFQNTVTAGIVSCVDRKSSDLGLGGFRREYLQTDCAINKGNSGGPLVNVNGEIVGINNLKVLGADGLNFAVPIDSVYMIMEHFKRHGRVIRTRIGLTMIDLNDMIAAQLKEKNPAFPNVNKGVLVSGVLPGSPAECAGFHRGDVLVEFGGKPVESIKQIMEIMGDQVGKPLIAVVKRENDASWILTVIPEEADPYA